jgi:hypothetical protein
MSNQAASRARVSGARASPFGDIRIGYVHHLPPGQHTLNTPPTPLTPRRLSIATATMLMMVLSACAARDIPPDPGPPMMSRASWTIRAGGIGKRGGIVCRSDMPAPCVVPLAEKDEDAFASVSVYLYATGMKTVYTGVFFVSFIGDFGYERPVVYEIEPGDVPTAVAVFGRVVKAPGTYEFRLSLSTQGGDPAQPPRFAFAIPVKVVAP